MIRICTYAGLVGLSMVASTGVHAAANQAVLGGLVVANCEVTGVKPDIGFGTNMQPGDAVDSEVDLFCNDFDGATIKLVSSEGGLESDDVEDLEIEYVANLKFDAIGLDLTLDTGLNGQGNNDETVETTITGSEAFARGGTGRLLVTLSDAALFAGGYNDTLTISITAE